jgi:hypothetical protein
LFPLHAPDAVQLVVFVLDHVSVAEEPLMTEGRFEEKVMVGSGVWVGCLVSVTTSGTSSYL